MKRPCLWVAAVLALCLAGCGESGPVHLGILGDFETETEGQQSGFRNGVFLAVEEVNDKGGIGGRPIEIHVQNDHGDAGSAPRAAERLVREGVVAIIGNGTSATTGAVIPVANRHKVPLLGTLSTSSEYSGKKDFFVRTTVVETKMGEALATYAAKALKLRSVGAVLDERNRPFSTPFFQAFQKQLRALGADAEVVYPYAGVADLAEMGRQVAAFVRRGGGGALLVTNDVDTRHVAPVVHRVKNDLPLLGSVWAVPPVRAADGGPPENLIYPCTCNPDDTSPAFVEFRKHYEKRYAMPVDYHAVNGYEAVMLLAKAIAKGGTKGGKLIQAISGGTFDGLQGPIRIDPYGDSDRALYMLKISGGVARRIDAPAGK